MKIIEEAVKNEYEYIENFGIETFDEYYELINKMYDTTAGCIVTTSKE